MKHIKLFERNERLSMYDLIVLSKKESAMILMDALQDFDYNEGYIKDIFKYCEIDVNFHGEWKSTPLMIASESDRLYALKELLNYPNIQVNAKDEWGMTALMFACEREHLEIVQELLKHSDLKINEGDKYDKTALHYALESDNVEVVKELLNHPSININAKDSDGKGVWGYAGKQCRDTFPELKFNFEWEESDSSIERTFTFRDFSQAMYFIKKIGEISEQEGHHPDILLFNYNNVKIMYTTHDEGRVTEKDYECSRLVDDEYRDI